MATPTKRVKVEGGGGGEVGREGGTAGKVEEVKTVKVKNIFNIFKQLSLPGVEMLGNTIRTPLPPLRSSTPTLPPPASPHSARRTTSPPRSPADPRAQSRSGKRVKGGVSWRPTHLCSSYYYESIRGYQLQQPPLLRVCLHLP